MCLGSWTSRGFVNYTQTGLLLLIVINLYIKDLLDPSFCTEANIFIHFVTHSYSRLMSWSFILTVTAPSSYCVVTETSQTVGDGHGEARHWTENPGEVWARMQHIRDMMRTWGSRRLCWVYPICPFRLCCLCVCVCDCVPFEVKYLTFSKENTSNNEWITSAGGSSNVLGWAYGVICVCALSQVPSWQMVISGQPLSSRCLNSSREAKAGLIIYLSTQAQKHSIQAFLSL